MEDGSDAQHVRVFWDTAHGNELALHDLRSSLSKCEAIQGRDARRLVLENTRDQINDFFFFIHKKDLGQKSRFNISATSKPTLPLTTASKALF